MSQTLSPSRALMVIEGQSAQKDQRKIGPDRAKVVILNNPNTSARFVVDLLMEVFNRDFQSARNVTLDVHLHGRGVAGSYMREVAQIMLSASKEYIQNANQTLQMKLEPE